MNRIFSLTAATVCALALSTGVANTPDTAPNTVKILASDSRADIITKAANLKPSENQLAALDNEYIAFVHFGPNTFTRREWGTGMEDPKIFDLKTLDTDQWCKAMKDAGMKMVIFTAKHHDGFVLWPSRYTNHGIMSTDFRDGKGDVMKDLSESCRKYGLKLGIYLSPADLYQIESPDGLYGNLSQKSERTIPREAEGRPFENKTTFKFEVDDYNEYFLNQLFELLTEYGPISEVWFDGAHPKRKGGQTYDYHAWRKLIRTLAPEAVIFGREDIRWCGNEGGHTRDTEWNVITYDENPDTASVFRDITDVDLGSRERLYKGKYLHYQPTEVNTSIRSGWFYSDDDHQKVRTADDVFDIYERAVGGNAIFLLNIPPNRDGLFSERDVEVITETGKRIRDTYSTDFMAKSNAPATLTDDDITTYVEYSEPIEVAFDGAKTINRVLIQEAISISGERIESHAVDAWIDGAWKEVASATNVGHKRILRFPDVTTDRIRLRVTESRATPAISKLSAHRYASHPPRLAAIRDIDGNVTIKAVTGAFQWRTSDTDVPDNLNLGYTIHYTTDGSTPNASSAIYKSQFKMDNGTLKAIAMANGESGAPLEERMGFIKQGWRAFETESQEENESNRAFDENKSTYWSGTKGKPLCIDLGEKKTISGISYTPSPATSTGLLSKGEVLTSNDGKKWKSAGTFEFGNMQNDPTQRSHYLSKSQKGRYVKIVALETADGGDTVTIGEIDIF